MSGSVTSIISIPLAAKCNTIRLNKPHYQQNNSTSDVSNDKGLSLEPEQQQNNDDTIMKFGKDSKASNAETNKHLTQRMAPKLESKQQKDDNDETEKKFHSEYRSCIAEKKGYFKQMISNLGSLDSFADVINEKGDSIKNLFAQIDESLLKIKLQSEDEDTNDRQPQKIRGQKNRINEIKTNDSLCKKQFEDDIYKAHPYCLTKYYDLKMITFGKLKTDFNIPYFTRRNSDIASSIRNGEHISRHLIDLHIHTSQENINGKENFTGIEKIIFGTDNKTAYVIQVQVVKRSLFIVCTVFCRKTTYLDFQNCSTFILELIEILRKYKNSKECPQYTNENNTATNGKSLIYEESRYINLIKVTKMHLARSKGHAFKKLENPPGLKFDLSQASAQMEYFAEFMANIPTDEYPENQILWINDDSIILPKRRIIQPEQNTDLQCNSYHERLLSFHGENQDRQPWTRFADFPPGPLVAAGFSCKDIGGIIRCNTCGFTANVEDFTDNDEGHAFKVHSQTKNECSFLKSFAPTTNLEYSELNEDVYCCTVEMQNLINLMKKAGRILLKMVQRLKRKFPT